MERFRRQRIPYRFGVRPNQPGAGKKSCRKTRPYCAKSTMWLIDYRLAMRSELFHALFQVA